MDLVILSDSFFNKYINCSEILEKRNRPYVCLKVQINGVTFAIPIRHHISHTYCYRTGEDSGLDYTKAVVITSPTDIKRHKAQINQAEYNAIKGKEHVIANGMSNFIKVYIKAKAYPNNQNYSNIRSMSTLQYFERYIR